MCCLSAFLSSFPERVLPERVLPERVSGCPSAFSDMLPERVVALPQCIAERVLPERVRCCLSLAS